MPWLLLLSGIIANASASVLIKVATMPPRGMPSFSNPLAAFANWPFWLGLILYGAAFLLYSATLSRLPLNVAHPILTSGAIALVALCSGLIFHESFPFTTIAGFLLIVVGVVLISLKAA